MPKENESKIVNATTMRNYKGRFKTPEEAWEALQNMEENGEVRKGKYGVLVFRMGEWVIWEG